MQDQGNYIWPLEQLHWDLISQQLPQFLAYKKVNQQLQLSYISSLAQLSTSETFLHTTKCMRVDRNEMGCPKIWHKYKNKEKAFTLHNDFYQPVCT